MSQDHNHSLKAKFNKKIETHNHFKLKHHQKIFNGIYQNILLIIKNNMKCFRKNSFIIIKLEKFNFISLTKDQTDLKESLLEKHFGVWIMIEI